MIPYYPDVAGKSAFRLALSRCYTALVNGLSGHKVHYYNGSVLCRRYQAMRWSPHNHGFTGFLADLITQLLAEGASYTEVAVVGVHVAKDHKATPLTFHNFFSTGLTLVGIFTRRLSYAIYRQQIRLHAPAASRRSVPVETGPSSMTSDSDKLRCHVCEAPAIAEVDGYATFRRITSDCKPWPAGGRLGACRACGCIQNAVDSAWQNEVRQIYADYTVYHQSGGVEQAIFEQGSGEASRRSHRLVARLQASAQLPARGRLLDFGCGNGAFLEAFNALIPGWTLAGAELSDKYQAIVEGLEGVEALYTCPPEQIPGYFDLVVAMHALDAHPGAHRLSRRGCVEKLEPGGQLDRRGPGSPAESV